MILKVKNNKESWSYFECAIIHSKYSSLEKIGNKSDAVILFEFEPIKGDTLGSKQVKVLNLETNKSHLRTIITDRVCYILNNEGKTIDRIQEEILSSFQEVKQAMREFTDTK